MSGTVLRHQIAELVAGLRAHDAREASDQAETLDWIASGAPLFRVAKPATPPKHLVSYFLLVDGDHALLVDHINAGLWLPSGGHVEPEEHPAETVRRECIEELGVPASFLHAAPQFLTVTETVGSTAGHWDVSLWYVLRGQRDQVLHFDKGEFNGIRWFHRDALPVQRSDPELARFAAKLWP